ncbi:hypothetical protein GBA52_028851 [Prunus armeniaca]|nr:hypothetical protein GBA52_028851 [Prunus armeniaca]
MAHHTTLKNILFGIFADMDAKDDVPWVVVGDLNEVAWHFEKKVVPFRIQREKRYLVNFMDNNLMDLGYNGHIFTWERSLGNSSFLLEKGLIVLSNSFWLGKVAQYNCYNWHKNWIRP